MKEYAAAKIRNVAIVGHQDSAKTVLAEAMLFSAGAITRIGRVEDGNTTLDFAPEEIARQISVHSGVASYDHDGHKINLIDTPGYEDFVGEVFLSIDVVDGALVALRADAGVEVGTEKMWGLLREREIPALCVVTKMDKEHADFAHCMEQMHESFGAGAHPFHLPIGRGDAFSGIVDLVAGKAWKISRDGKGTREEISVPADMADAVAVGRKDLLEAAAETDEALMVKYLETEVLSDDEFHNGLRKAVRSGDLFPVLCAAPALNMGADGVSAAIAEYLPSPEGSSKVTTDGNRFATDTNGPHAAFVFKNISDPHVGDMLFFRVYGGHFANHTDVYNSTRGASERLGAVFAVRGKHRDEIARIVAGDIGAVVKLKNTKVRDTLCDKNKEVKFKPTELPRPSIFSAILPAGKGDDEKLGSGLHRLHDEDPSFDVSVSKETRQILISGQGELHLDVVVGRLKERFGVGVIIEKPRIPYKETIKKKAEAQGRHKKQTGGRGQFGDVWLRIEPMARGEQFEFVDGVVGGSVPGKFIPAVEKGIVGTMEDGVIAGYPMVDIRATLFDGSYHAVDSSEQAFKTAGSLAFKAAIAQASPCLLEPIINISVKVPEEFMGDVMGDLSSRRGKIQGTEVMGKFVVIGALVPLAELYRYSTHLRSMTQGRGSHARELSHYEEVPHEITAKIIEESKKIHEEEHK